MPNIRTYAQQKSGLTRAVNSKRYDKVIAECKRTIAEWEHLPYGWPDDWHRWNVALSDAYSNARHEYVQGRNSVRPVPCTMDELRAL